MNPSDLHPEELLDRRRRGALSRDEQALLDAHLARCAACRVEATLGPEFTRLAAPAADDAAVLDRLIAAALPALASEALPSPRPAPASALVPVRSSSSSSWRRRWTRSGLLAAAALLVTAAAAAGVWQLQRARAQSAPLAAPPDTTVAAAPRVPARPTAPAPPVARAEEPPATAPELERPTPGAPASRGARVRAPVPHETPAAPSPAEPDDAAALFRAANAARHTGETARAAALYRALQQRFPSSEEAATSRVALGRLLLDRAADPRGAVAQFDRYLADGANRGLREEAMFARAQALGRLARPADEAAAWTALLRDYPRSMYAERARARLRALSPSP